MNVFRSLSVILLSLFTGPLYAEDAAPVQPWAEPDVVLAAARIGMSDEQKTSFRDNVTTFFQCRVKGLQSLMKARDQVDLARKARSKTLGCIHRLDKSMKGLVTDEQYPRYETYRDTLKKYLQEL
ncbi:MAG: hypothetical protein R3E84_07795 [Pseudomonadales bacterium]|nr:hypothetical protein [Pseudomonadales bacterium]